MEELTYTSSEMALYCYKIINLNEENLDLSKYPDDSALLLNNIDKYNKIQNCSANYMNVLKDIYSKYVYISKSSIIYTLNENCNEIIELVETMNYVPVVIMTNEIVDKSNIFFTLYFLNQYKKKTGKEINFVYEKTSDLFNFGDCVKITDTNLCKKEDFENVSYRESEEHLFLSKKTLIIFCDDFSYSGSQLNINMTGLDSTISVHDYKISFRYSIAKNVLFFLNIVGYTRDAYLKIKSVFSNSLQNVKFARRCIERNVRLQDIINDYLRTKLMINNNYIKDNDFYVMEKIDGKIIVKPQFKEAFDKIDNLTMIYPFHKYPDIISTTSVLCRIKTMENKYYFDLSEFKKIYPRINTLIKSEEDFDLFKILRHEPAIKFLLDNWNDDTQMNRFPWIKKCSHIDNDMLILYEGEYWIKMMKNCQYDSDWSPMSCNYKCIDSFYKFINWNSLNKYITVKENFIIMKESAMKKKYIKYKTKYLNLKKNSNK